MTQPYAKNRYLYTCPGISGFDRFGYAFEARLVGEQRASVSGAANAPMLFESWLLDRNAVARVRVGLLRNSRHHGRSAIGFADGHGKLFTDSELSARWPEPFAGG